MANKIAIKDVFMVSYVGDELIQHRTSIFIEGNVITKVGDTDQENRFSNSDLVIEGKDLIAIPELINLHAHAGPTAIRGLAEDLRLSEWLKEYVNPAHKVLTADDAEVDYELSYLEMIKSGITHVLDLYRFPHVGINVANRIGIRTTIAPYTSDVYEGFEKPETAVKYIEKYHEFNGLGRVWAGFEHLSYCSESCVQSISKAAKENGTGIHTHEFETLDFVENVVKTYGKRPLSVFKEFDMLNSNLILAHCVWPTPEELRVMAESGVSVSHNPVSNMKLASGIAPVTEMLRLGINVGLGTDGVKENNRLDIFQEMKVASLMQRVVYEKAQLMSAKEVFKMATVNGSKALRMKSGELKEGYLADLVLLDSKAPNLNPLYEDNVLSQVVFAAHPGNVKYVIVDGKLVVENGKSLMVDEDKIVDKAIKRGKELLKKLAKNN
jgi:5-methylthioadenosine/S-adenosylhomocysteine deaminase